MTEYPWIHLGKWLSENSICTYFSWLFHWDNGRNVLLAKSHQSVAKTVSYYRIITDIVFPGIVFIPPQNMYNFMLVKCTQRYNCHWLLTESHIYLTDTHLKQNWFSRAAFKHDFIAINGALTHLLRQCKTTEIPMLTKINKLCSTAVSKL